MNKYGQYCPTARATEILGDRWTLLIVRDLLFGAQHFNELERGLPGIPKALLADRLCRLGQFGLIERYGDTKKRRTGYRLTPAGLDLFHVIESLTKWGAKWAFGEPEQSELDPVLLLWWMRDRVIVDRLSQERVVVEFKFRESHPANYWLLLTPGDVSVCLKPPALEIDILVSASLAVFYQVWMGKIAFADAIRKGDIELEGPPALVRGFPGWFALSQAAGIVRSVSST